MPLHVWKSWKIATPRAIVCKTGMRRACNIAAISIDTNPEYRNILILTALLLSRLLLAPVPFCRSGRSFNMLSWYSRCAQVGVRHLNAKQGHPVNVVDNAGTLVFSRNTYRYRYLDGRRANYDSYGL